MPVIDPGAAANDPTMSPVISFTSANFGRILSAGDPRIMQFAMKYQF